MMTSIIIRCTPTPRHCWPPFPIPDPKRMRERKKEEINGEIPSPLDIPSGCPFRTRCPYATERCAQEKPQLRQVGNSKVACHLYDK